MPRIFSLLRGGMDPRDTPQGARRRAPGSGAAHPRIGRRFIRGRRTQPPLPTARLDAGSPPARL